MYFALGSRLMVGQGTLDPLMMVRIHPSQPGGVVEQRLVRGALNPQTRVQLPATLPFFIFGKIKREV